MKTTRRLIVIGFCLVLLIGFSGLRATEERAAQEGVSCTTCHDKPGSALLTSKGKFYEYTGSFEGYDKVIKQYRKCTKCHEKFPGSQKLTKRGQRLAEAGVTMEHIIEPARPAAEGDTP